MKRGKEAITVSFRDLTPNLQNQNISQEEQNRACVFWKGSSDISEKPSALVDNHCHYSYLILYLMFSTQKRDQKSIKLYTEELVTVVGCHWGGEQRDWGGRETYFLQYFFL